MLVWSHVPPAIPIPRVPFPPVWTTWVHLILEADLMELCRIYYKHKLNCIWKNASIYIFFLSTKESPVQMKHRQIERVQTKGNEWWKDSCKMENCWIELH